MTKVRRLAVWQETILLVVAAMMLAVVVKTFLVQAFYIPSESMEPTMLVNDKIIVEKVSYWRGEPHRGDVVVFDDPGGWLNASDSDRGNVLQRVLTTIGLAPTGGHLIKRVIGVANDHIHCCTKQGQLTVNGVAIDESKYVLDPSVIRDRPFDVYVRPGHIWVMGDNRGNSADSVAHLGDPGGGQVKVGDVVGKAWVRLWPLSRAGFLHDVDAFAQVK